VLHLTISGDLGSGKSSVAEQLSQMLGFEVTSTGAILRAIAADMGVSALEANLVAETDTSIDDRVDAHTVRLAREATAPIIFDSRLAWNFVPRSLRVRLIVDPLVAAERIHGRGPATAEAYTSTEHAFDLVLDRADAEVRRYWQRYGVDISRLSNYDLVIDTTTLTLAQVSALVADNYAGACRDGFRPASDAEGERLWISPRTVVPAFADEATGAAVLEDDAVGQAQGDDGRLVVVYSRPFAFAVAGKSRLTSAIGRGEGAIPARVLAEGDQLGPDGRPARSYPARYAAAPATKAWERGFGLDFRGLRRFLRRPGGTLVP
jgi:predicted cytidylate kinase